MIKKIPSGMSEFQIIQIDKNTLPWIMQQHNSIPGSMVTLEEGSKMLRQSRGVHNKTNKEKNKESEDFNAGWKEQETTNPSSKKEAALQELLHSGRILDIMFRGVV